MFSSPHTRRIPHLGALSIREFALSSANTGAHERAQMHMHARTCTHTCTPTASRKAHGDRCVPQEQQPQSTCAARTATYGTQHMRMHARARSPARNSSSRLSTLSTRSRGCNGNSSSGSPVAGLGGCSTNGVPSKMNFTCIKRPTRTRVTKTIACTCRKTFEGGTCDMYATHV